MTWVKTGDEFVDDAADLSDAAVRTHMDALHWSARRLLDLHVPKRDLPRFAFSPDAGRAVDELVTVGWWLDKGSSWYLAYRPRVAMVPRASGAAAASERSSARTCTPAQAR
jgi:hypothetical protein